jgi:hypothetical protein
MQHAFRFYKKAAPAADSFAFPSPFTFAFPHHAVDHCSEYLTLHSNLERLTEWKYTPIQFIEGFYNNSSEIDRDINKIKDYIYKNVKKDYNKYNDIIHFHMNIYNIAKSQLACIIKKYNNPEGLQKFHFLYSCILETSQHVKNVFWRTVERHPDTWNDLKWVMNDEWNKIWSTNMTRLILLENQVKIIDILVNLKEKPKRKRKRQNE